MHRFFVDSIALNFNRRLLDLGNADIQVTTTPSVLKWVRSLADKGDDLGVLRDLNEAIDKRTIDFEPVDLTEMMSTRGIHDVEADLLGHAEAAATKYPEDDVRVISVASHTGLNESAARLGLGIITPEEVYALVDQLEREQKAAEAAEQRRLKQQRRNDIVKAVAGVVIAAVAGVIANHIELVVATISIWGAVLAFATAGPLIYGLRGRQRLIYGVAEVGVGYIAIGSALLDAQTRSNRTKEALAVLGGLYIVVRGLDNVGKALEKTPYEGRWRALSGEKKPA